MLGNPLFRPLDGLDIHVADVRRQKDHPLNRAVLEPFQTQVALHLHQVHRQRFIQAEVPHVDAQQGPFIRHKFLVFRKVFG